MVQGLDFLFRNYELVPGPVTHRRTGSVPCAGFESYWLCDTVTGTVALDAFPLLSVHVARTV
jgi:hypothetical protein